MRAHLLLGLLCLVVSLALAVPAARGQGGTVSSSYMQTFDGMPVAPTAYRPPGWDVQIHSRDGGTTGGTWYELESMSADHGPACEGPPATHALGGDYPSHVFQCHDHVMTSIKADGYGVVYLTPPALLDWSQGEAVLRFDMSTLRTSLRDWVDIWLTPYDQHLALPLEDDFAVDLAGAPPTNLHIRMDSFNGDTIWTLRETHDGLTTVLGPPWGFTWPSLEAVVQPVGGPSASRRDTFELRLRDGHLAWGMPGLGVTWVDQDIAPLLFQQAVVQFGHHSYFPSKDCTPSGTLTCRAATWHWDNVLLSPAVPITITSLQPRQLTDQAPGGWAFPAPAVADTTLQFSADNAPGELPSIDLSWDDGTTWQTVAPAPSGIPDNATNHARSYRVPVPVGATRVEVRGQGGWWGAYWRAKDAALWSETPDLSPMPPPPTPLPETPTPAPPRPTQIPEATSTPLPTATTGATQTPVPTSTPFPPPTRTPSPTPEHPGTLPAPDPSRPCQVLVSRFGVPTWKDAPASQCR